MSRRFNQSQRVALFLAADGCCSICGIELQLGWHGDHVEPYSKGGLTDVTNGQALCPACNLSKGATVLNLREWQQQALDAFHALPLGTKDMTVSATPGAGKTKFALHLAGQQLSQGQIHRIAVVAPTDALRQQWADAAAEMGLNLMPVAGPDDYEKSGYDGCVVTYQQLLGAGADLLRRVTRHPTLAIIDEIHHAGDDRKWGESLTRALELVAFRLALTGTPWRRDNTSPIPFVRYDTGGMVVVDYAYEYGAAVADGVCRRIEFHAYDGEAKWIDPARTRKTHRDPEGVASSVQIEVTAKLGADMDKDDVSAALDVLYEPKHRWMPAMLERANNMLDELREEVPDAAGLVVCERKWHAEAYAIEIEKLTGTKPPVVVSDPVSDPGGKLAKQAIDRFRGSTGRWIVAVKMISEGVDIPRLAIGVYASKTQTPLFFRQVVGRFVRTRKDEEFNARLLIPAVPELLRHALEIEEELRHQLDLAAEEEEKARAEAAAGSNTQGMFDFRTPVSASAPIFDRAILGGMEATPEEVAQAELECARAGIPTRYAMNLIPLLRSKLAPAAMAAVSVPNPVVVPRHKREKLLRGDIATLANRYARHAGKEPKEVNADLLRAGHPARSKASVEELEAIKQTVERWLSQL
ncbi:DEAD/DEAH box helicase family protein [Nonomuraea dietziae]|uniref:DEAD/DEAH box helicase family protein n=1 Tax=Nonomuraea dietziae TaxID=65515 RepID=UPI0033FC4996